VMSTKINKIPSRQSPIGDFRHQSRGRPTATTLWFTTTPTTSDGTLPTTCDVHGRLNGIANTDVQAAFKWP